MKKQDRKDLEKYIQAIQMIRGLRTFPNGRKMDIYESVVLNNIGKLMEHIYYPFLYGLVRGKKNKKLFKILRECRVKIDEAVISREIKYR